MSGVNTQLVRNREIQIPARQEESFKQAAHAFRNAAATFDEPKIPYGISGDIGKQAYEMGIKAASMAGALAADAKLSPEQAGALKLALLALQYPKISRWNGNGGAAAGSFLTENGFMATTPAPIVSDLFEGLFHTGKMDFNEPQRTALGQIIQQVQIFQMLENKRWTTKEAAAESFLKAAENIPSHTDLATAKMALEEPAPDPLPAKNQHKFRPYNTSFSKLADAYFEALLNTETATFVDLQAALKNHPRFPGVGKAVIKFFEGPVEQTLAADIEKTVSAKARQVIAPIADVHPHKMTHSYPNIILSELYLGAHITLPSLQSRMLQEQTLRPRAEYLQTVLKPLEAELLVHGLVNAIHGRLPAAKAA